MKFIRIILILLKAIFIVPLKVLYAMLVDDKPAKRNTKKSKRAHEKPESFIKGEEFEKYVRTKFFTKEKYTLVHKTHSYEENSEDFVESSLWPDYKFRCKNTGKEFFVEVKYRSSTIEGKFEWCNNSQFKRYKSYNEHTPVILALGMGGTSNKPDKVALIPLKDIEYIGLYESFIDKYIVGSNQLAYT